MDKKKTVWHCKRCDVGGVLNPVYHSKSQIEDQMKAQYPNPEMKYIPK
jgi:hypothetical protein